MKKYTLQSLSRLLFLFIAVASFSSCVKNEVSEGIEDIRKAQADKIKAEAAYTAAMTAIQEAEAALIQAQVEYQNIMNEYQQSVNEINLNSLLMNQQLAQAQAQAAIKQAEADFQLALLALTQAISDANAEYLVKYSDAMNQVFNLSSTKLNIENAISIKEGMIENEGYDWILIEAGLVSDSIQKAKMIEDKNLLLAALNTINDDANSLTQQIADLNAHLLTLQSDLQTAISDKSLSFATFQEVADKLQHARDLIDDVKNTTISIDLLKKLLLDNETLFSVNQTLLNQAKANEPLLQAAWDSYKALEVLYAEKISVVNEKQLLLELENNNNSTLLASFNSLNSLKNDIEFTLIPQSENKINTYKTQISNSEANIANLTTERDDKKAVMDQAKADFDADPTNETLKADYELALDEYNTAQYNLDYEIVYNYDYYQKVLTEEETKLAELKIQLQDTRAQFLIVSADYDDSNLKLSQLQTDVANSQADANAVAIDMNTASNEFTEIMSSGPFVGATIEQFKQQLSELEAEVNTLEITIINFKSQIASLENYLSSLSADYQQVLSDLSTFEDQYKAAYVDYTLAIGNVSALQQLITDTENTITSLENQNDVQAQITQLEAEIVQLNKDLLVITNELERGETVTKEQLQNELADLQAQLTVVLADIQTYTNLANYWKELIDASIASNN